MLYESLIKKCVSERRYFHSKNVAKTSEILSNMYGADPAKAKIAGMLHDITKEWDYSEHINLLNRYKIRMSKYEFNSKKLIHALTGSVYLRYVLEIKDRDIINSVKYHTTARSGMSILEKIIYISDFISEDRTFIGVERLRYLAWSSMDLVFPAALSFSISELINEKRIIHPNTLNAYNEAVNEYF